MILICLLSLLLFSFVVAQNNSNATPTNFTIVKLAKYEFEEGLNFTEHARLDLDQKRIEDELGKRPPAWALAQQVYVNGANSAKSNGLRTLRGFSADAAEKLRGEPYFELYQKYYGCATYADTIVSNALSNSGEFANTEDIFRVESAKKGTAYLNVWMYVIHELEDAINDCVSGDLTNNDKGVKAWDEGWAFYAGSLERSDGSGDGVMLHSLAEKRSANFETYGNVSRAEKKPARVNEEALKLWRAGRDKLNGGKCREAINDKNSIVQQMTIPLVQGLLRYVVFTKNKKENDNAKEHAEGLAFLRALLPILDHCDPAAAKMLVANFRPGAKPPMKDSIQAVSAEIHENLGCMGMTCEDVGTIADLPPCKTSPEFKVVPMSDKPAVENRKTISEPKTNECSSDALLGSAAVSVNIGAIVGGVIGCIILLAIIILGVLYFKRRKKLPPGPIQAIPRSNEPMNVS